MYLCLEFEIQKAVEKMTEFIDLDAIALRLVELHEKTGMSAKEFSGETGIPPSTFSQIKGGATKINVETINKVIQRWGGQYSPMWFLFGKEDGGELLDASEGSKEAGQNSLSPLVLDRLEELGKIKATLAQSNPKEISHITVYYTDKSFANYRLSND